MPCLGVRHLLLFHHHNKRESRWETSCRLPQKVWFCGSGTCRALLLSWKVDHLIKTVIALTFCSQNSLCKHTHMHICKCMLMYFCAWLGCGTTAKSKSPDLMLLLCWLLVCCSSHSRYQIRDHTLQSSTELISREGESTSWHSGCTQSHYHPPSPPLPLLQMI